MPPFGNLYDIPVYVDKTLSEDENIVFLAGNHKVSMRMAYKDFAEIVKPNTEEFAVKLH